MKFICSFLQILSSKRLFLNKAWEVEALIKMIIAFSGFISVLFIRNLFTYPIWKGINDISGFSSNPLFPTLNIYLIDSFVVSLIFITETFSLLSHLQYTT